MFEKVVAYSRGLIIGLVFAAILLYIFGNLQLISGERPYENMAPTSSSSRDGGEISESLRSYMPLTGSYMVLVVWI